MKPFRLIYATLLSAASFQPFSLQAYNNYYGVNINTAIGATTFYQNGITGQNASVANIEAGHFWTGHESLAHISSENFFNGTEASGTGTPQDHATGVAMTIGGRGTGNITDTGVLSQPAWGIAPGATLDSGNIATSVGSNGGFTISWPSLTSTYAHYFSTVDVINSSWGGSDANGHLDATYFDWENAFIESEAYDHTATTMVVAAGNSGQIKGAEGGANSVGSPAVSFNVISVGALNSALNGAADFSSYGPSDFFLPSASKNGITGTTITGTTITGARATVHIVAPGQYLNLAYSTSDSTSYPTVSGTSFAAPTVAGVVALLYSKSHTDSMSKDSRDARVIKAVLLNSADKLSGWDNGTVLTDSVTADAGTGAQTYNNVLLTTQALDYKLGAGALDATAAYDQYTKGNTATGWLLDDIAADTDFKTAPVTVSAETTLTVTLTWFAESNFTSDNNSIDHYALTDLNLEIWSVNNTGELDVLLAASRTLYDTVEHVHMEFAEETEFVVRVVNAGETFDLFNTSDGTETFALAWNIVGNILIPEPSTYALWGGAVLLAGAVLRRRRKTRN